MFDLRFLQLFVNVDQNHLIQEPKIQIYLKYKYFQTH